MTHKQTIGKFGETLAKNYLAKHGYEIKDANVKLSYQELDIVAVKNGLVVFVEVKTRLSQFYGPAENALAYTKLKRFQRAIEMYSADKKLNLDDIRADLITIDLDGVSQTAKIRHYRDVI